MTTTDARPLCLATKLQLPATHWHGYGSHTIEVAEREVRTTPDGTTTVHVLRAGTFCSSRCAAAWLMGATPNEIRRPDDDDTVSPCMVDPDQEPF